MKYVELGNLNIPIVQPKKGVDYYTDIEKEEIIEEVSKRVNSTIEPMENERQTSETQRESNEEVRNSQENTRQVNESERISNETIRQNNEDIRLNNENLRLSNEQNRVEAEELRNANFVNQMSKNEEALQNIKDMTVEYNENAVSKVLEFNNNCQVRTEDFNNNAEIQKGNFDANANEKIAQYNAHVSELTEDISNIKYEQNLQNTKLTELENKNIEQDTEISNLKQEDITQNTNIQNNAKGLEELQQENIKLKEKLEKQNSQIPTGQASGENITINDSSDLPFEKFKITGNSKQNGTPTPEVLVDIKNVTSINEKICNENLLSNKFEDYDTTSGSYGYKEIIKAFEKEYLILTITDKDKSIDLSNIFFGFTGNGVNATDGNSWIVSNGTILGTELNEKRYLSTNSLKYFSFYPNNQATFNKIFSRFNITIELSDKLVPLDYVEYQSQNVIFPLSEGQKLMKDDYLADDGIHTKKYQRVFDGTESWTLTMNNDIPCFYIRNSNLSTALNEEHEKVCTHFPYIMQSFGTAPVNTICENTLGGGLPMFIFKTNVATTLEGWKTWLANQKTAGTPLIVEYKLAKEVITPYTEEQQIVYEQIKEACSYKNVTNIFSLDEVSPILEVTYKKDLETMFNNINNAILGGN